MRFETKAIHAGQEPEPAYGAVNVPVYQTSTYAQSAVGKHGGYDYARTGNPTRTALQVALAALEGGRGALSFSSGMAAEANFLYLLKPGDHVVMGDDVYGGTYRLVSNVLADWGIGFDTVDLTDLEALRGALRDETRLIWCETPTNPLLKIVDVAAVAAIAREAGAWCVVDNTFASPYLQQPLALGADAVIHSTTKYLGGHSDVVGGAVVVADAGLAERLAFLQNAAGSAGAPFDAWLTLRGVKTLAVRMDRHCDNGAQVAMFLANHSRVAQVYYPGLADHPGHEVAAKQMRGFGGMVSFRHADGEAAAVRMCGRTRLFTLGESLGGVESLIEHPAKMTHASAAGSPLQVPSDLVRLSVGIENIDDLIEDLRAALG